MTYQFQSTVDVLGPDTKDAWGDPVIGPVLETLDCSIVETSEVVTDPASGKVSNVEQWSISIRKREQDFTDSTTLRETSTGVVFDVFSARQSPFDRQEWLLVAKVRAG